MTTEGKRGKKAGKRKPATVDKQRNNNGATQGRGQGGRFEKGNQHGFKKGESGNPAGRPKSATFSEAMRAILKAESDADAEFTNAEQLAKATLKMALAGSIKAVKEINDRVEGKARQPIDLSGEVGMYDKTVKDFKKERAERERQAAETLALADGE